MVNKSILALMIVNIILDNYNNYFVELSNIQIRSFSKVLLSEAPYIDESLRVVGSYQELVDVNEIDEKQKEEEKEKEYDKKEEQTSLDLDDYEEDDLFDDFDPSDEFMDTLN